MVINYLCPSRSRRQTLATLQIWRDIRFRRFRSVNVQKERPADEGDKGEREGEKVLAYCAGLEGSCCFGGSVGNVEVAAYAPL
jgi:hypothetical protein